MGNDSSTSEWRDHHIDIKEGVEETRHSAKGPSGAVGDSLHGQSAQALVETLVVRNTFFEVDLSSHRDKRRTSSEPPRLSCERSVPDMTSELHRAMDTLSNVQRATDQLTQTVFAAARSTCQLEMDFYWQCCRHALCVCILKIYHGKRAKGGWKDAYRALSLGVGMPRNHYNTGTQKEATPCLRQMSRLAVACADTFPRGLIVVLFPARRIFHILPHSQHSIISAFQLMVEVQGCRWQSSCILVAFGVERCFQHVFISAVWCPWWSTWSRLDSPKARRSSVVWFEG